MDIKSFLKYLLLVFVFVFGVQVLSYFEENSDVTTTLQVYNPTNDTIPVYLTLNPNGKDWVQNVNGIFDIISNDTLQGMFLLPPKTLVEYDSQKAISGNISFFYAPLNCPFPAPTLYEFCLNNSNTISKAQETCDISCVFGVSSIGSISFSGGGVWNSGGNDTITYIKNDSLYKNTGLKGVYPYGCTTCTGRSGMVDCENKQRYENVNKNSICNIQRDANNSGGIVKITYIRSLYKN